MLWLLAILVLFHISIILKIIPYDITWGGILKNDTDMYLFEGISILMTLCLFFILLIKGRYIPDLISPKIVNGLLWGFLFLFGMNTITNIFAETTFEKYFALLTVTFSYLIWVILKQDRIRTQHQP